MWSTGYRDIPYWQDMSVPTYLAPIGLSLYLALSFVGGHVILSIGSPIALVETLTPAGAASGGSGRSLIWVVALLYAAACALVLKDAYDTGEATRDLGPAARLGAGRRSAWSSRRSWSAGDPP